MKKAIVIGGSNGIGLALCKELCQQDFFVEVLDVVEPDINSIEGSLHYSYCDLVSLDEELISNLAQDKEVEVLIITAGIGRISKFEYFDPVEVEKTYMVDTVAPAIILNKFYHRIKSKNCFYTCIMGSIAGWLNSPMAAVYSAAKAGIVRLVEALNIELEVDGIDNRILDVSPASFKGSRFYGGNNDLHQLSELAADILHNLFEKKSQFIPQYTDVLKDVLERYHRNPHEFGIQSYQYKQKSNRVDNNRHTTIGYLSGTFDLFHIGHLNLLRKAKSQCDYLIVGVHSSGKWKGKETFIPLEERKAIVESCQYVDKVVDSCPEDADAWKLWKYDKLFVGSDYKGSERFLRYEEYFKDKNVEIVYFPYTTGTSSTQLRKAIARGYDQKNN